MKLAALILAAATLDLVTMLALPPGSELNPIASTLPLAAVILKATVAIALASLVLRHTRYFSAVGTFGASVWAYGAIVNMAVMA